MPGHTETPRLMRIGDVCQHTGLSRTTIYRLMDSGQFPQRRQLTPNGGTVVWLGNEIEDWLVERLDLSQQ
ncbi:AlpA family phage regulatory protein [Parasphingopyxis sp. CP4]|uniref:helix-turn-helix transcriptional regulator n=1 Tax=Parasphingopyxis sp. CP4 TaxID=2724527 RepID=UPI0015A22DE1|nr:AlpA family phage regulatory protein [Parasphingopyxis sp. CP4]QLC21221.1 AlpA family phage regulatory protein [Parasphingopyxis sp. CP4]